MCIVYEDMLSEFCKGPSTKYVHSNGEWGGPDKSVYLLFL